MADHGTSDITVQPRSSGDVWRVRALTIWSIIGIGVIIYMLGVVLRVLAVPLGIVIWTTIVVFLLGWQVDALEKRGFSRLAGTSIAYAGFLAILAVIGSFLFSPFFKVSDQFKNLISGAPDYVAQVGAWFNDMYARYADIAQNPTVAQMLDDFQSSATAFVQDFASNSVLSLFEAGSVTASMLISFGFGLVVAFWLLLEWPGIEREARRLFAGKHYEDFHFFGVTMSRAVGGFIRATLVQCSLIAFACIIVFTVVGVPNPIALSLLVGVVNVIPVAGPWIAAVIVVLSLVFSDALLALIAVIALTIIQRVVYTFVSPKIMGDSVDVHPALVILAMMIGYAVGVHVAGFPGSLVGMLLSIPLAAVAKSTFVYYFEKRTGRALVAEDGVMFKGVPAADGRVNPARDAVTPAPPRPSIKAMQTRKEMQERIARRSKAAKKRSSAIDAQMSETATARHAEKRKTSAPASKKQSSESMRSN